MLAHIEFRSGKPKIRHPGTYNANPLSAAAGISALERVATGKPTRDANEAASKLKRQLNEMFAARDFDWVCYGDFSLLHLLPDYKGPRPDNDDFIPHDGSVAKLDGDKNAGRTHSFRQAMLLNGMDLPGLGLFLTACHTKQDIEKTVAATERAIVALRANGI